MFDTKLFSKPKIGGLAVVATVVVLLMVVITICVFGALVRIAGMGTASTCSSVSMMIKCSLAAVRLLRDGGFVMRGGTGGASGSASKLHELVADESLASK